MAISQVTIITTILFASAYSVPRQTGASGGELSNDATASIRHYSWWPPMSPLADVPPVFEIITTPAPSVLLVGSSDGGSSSNFFPSGTYFIMPAKPPSGTLAMPPAQISSRPESDRPVTPPSSEKPVLPVLSDNPVTPSFTMPAKPPSDKPVTPSFTMPAKPPSDMPVTPSFTMPAKPSSDKPVTPSFTMPAKPPSDTPVTPSFTMPAKPPSEPVTMTVTPTGPPGFSLVEECLSQLSITFDGVNNPWQIYYNKPRSSLSIEERKIKDQVERCIASGY